MVLKWTLSGTVWTPEIGKMLLAILPFVVAGMIFGDFWNSKVDQRKFRILVYSVLIIAGLMLAGKIIRKMLC